MIFAILLAVPEFPQARESRRVNLIQPIRTLAMLTSDMAASSPRPIGHGSRRCVRQPIERGANGAKLLAQGSRRIDRNSGFIGPRRFEILHLQIVQFGTGFGFALSTVGTLLNAGIRDRPWTSTLHIQAGRAVSRS
jgi:hypothetical protein